MPIPDFRPDGYLPEGLHGATLEEVEQRFGWNERRRQLLARVLEWITYARAVGARRFLLNGSFVTAKEEPNDVDAACLLPDDFMKQHQRGKVEAVLLYSMVVTQYPQELYGVATHDDWERWVHFYRQTRDQVGKGVIEVRL